MPQLELQLLGALRARIDGVERLIERQKAQALLAYLALTGQRQSRSTLAALLWPDLPAERATANLRQALYALNNALGADVIASDRTSVELNSAAIDLDVARFRALLTAGGTDDLRAAAALYRGDLLEGLDPSDSAEFSEWQFFAREALRRDFAQALDTLAERIGPTDPLAAAAFARRRLALDPLHEPTHRRLMQFYAAANDRAAALRQYAECSRILREELEAEPEPETSELFNAIRRGEMATAPSGAPHSPAPPLIRSRSLLPTPLTPFFGREAELADLGVLLRDPTRRLITLLGPGGIGKTRLAIEAARLHGAHFSDGVCFVNLAPVTEGDPMLLTIATALGLNLARIDSLADQLADYLRPRMLLIIADNVEQLVPEAARLADLLAAAPQVTLLATSRERLGLIGEWTLDIDGMPTPPHNPEADEHYPALDLFLNAVLRAAPGKTIDADERAAAAEICRIVGGAPLAIELAAAWARHLPISTIVTEIGCDMDFLAGSARSLPERHRGLRVVFEHSWRLLNADERSAFSRLAVLWRDFDVAAAEAVLNHGRAHPLNRPAVLTLLADLADKSLLRQLSSGRYTIHELLRQYAFERISADPTELALARAGHSAHFIGRLRAAEAGLKGAHERATLDTIAADLDNIRSAWRFAVEHADRRALSAAAESLFLFYETQSLFDEGEEQFGRAAGAVSATNSVDDEILLGNLLARQGWFDLRLYRFDLAEGLLRWALELLEPHIQRREVMLGAVLANFQLATGGRLLKPQQVRHQLRCLRRNGDPWTLAFALQLLGSLSSHSTRSNVYFRESLRIAEQIGNRRLTATALDALADASRDRGALTEARRYWERGLVAHRELGNRWGAAFTLDNLGFVVRLQGEYALARALHEESLAFSRDVGDRLGIAGSIDNIGLVALDEGDLEPAEALFREGLAIRQSVGHAGSTSVSQENLGMLALLRGNPEQALACFQASYDNRIVNDDMWLVTRSLTNIARAQQALGNVVAAREALLAALRDTRRLSSLLEAGWTLLATAEYHLCAGYNADAAELAASVLHALAESTPLRRTAEALLSRSTVPSGAPRPLLELIDEQVGRL
jgi:predicted ATPase/DNA-binding SARP family transcriptional activator